MAQKKNPPTPIPESSPDIKTPKMGPSTKHVSSPAL